MKIIKTVYFTVFLILINVCNVSAGTTPSAPSALPGSPVEPPDGSIEGNILILVLVALIFGLTVIYKNKIKKASV